MAMPKHHQSSSQRSTCKESCSGRPTEQRCSTKVNKQKLFVLVIVVIKHFEIGLVDINLYIDFAVFCK